MIGSLNKALGPRIEDWNEQLLIRSNAFGKRFNDVFIAIHDAYGIFSEVLDNPQKHGYPDILSICYEGCIWYDHIHPTAQVQELFAEGLVSLLNRN
jgi:phospholipase/lecithinase/hemolysin